MSVERGSKGPKSHIPLQQLLFNNHHNNHSAAMTSLHRPKRENVCVSVCGGTCVHGLSTYVCVCMCVAVCVCVCVCIHNHDMVCLFEEKCVLLLFSEVFKGNVAPHYGAEIRISRKVTYKLKARQGSFQIDPANIIGEQYKLNGPIISQEKDRLT